MLRPKRLTKCQAPNVRLTVDKVLYMTEKNHERHLPSPLPADYGTFRYKTTEFAKLMSGIELIGPEVDAEWKRLLMQLISEQLTDFTGPLSDAPESLNFHQHVATPLSKQTLTALFDKSGITDLLASLGITNIRLHGWLYIIGNQQKDSGLLR